MLMMILTALLLSCTQESPEISQVKGIVMQYNALLTDGYLKQNMNPLQRVATDEIATKAYHHMAALGESNVRMVSELLKMTFDGVTFAGQDAVTVTTREMWNFAHNNLITGQTVFEEKEYPYDLTYELKKVNGQWKIYRITATGEERSNGASAVKPGPAGTLTASPAKKSGRFSRP